MKYTLLIYGTPERQPRSEAEGMALMEEFIAYSKAVHEAGILDAGEALESVETATTVGADGVVTDGPYAEAREFLGGFYVIDVPDLDTALGWAKRCPGTKYGKVEVRPVAVFDS